MRFDRVSDPHLVRYQLALARSSFLFKSISSLFHIHKQPDSPKGSKSWSRFLPGTFHSTFEYRNVDILYKVVLLGVRAS